MGALTHTTHSILILFGVILSVNSIPYSKYGRQCSDIGCLSSQVCVMAYESCSYDQRDGKDCGRYPTCKKNTDPSVQNGNSGLSLNPAPDNTKFMNNNDNVNANIPPIDPNYIFGSHQTTKSPYYNSHFPQPGNNVYQPMYPPLNQPPIQPQAPFSFGQFPQNPYYQRPVVTTTTEGNLWNQFLYNKQPEKRPKNSSNHLQHSSHLITACSLITFIYLQMARLF